MAWPGGKCHVTNEGDDTASFHLDAGLESRPALYMLLAGHGDRAEFGIGFGVCARLPAEAVGGRAHAELILVLGFWRAP